eukprot:5830895-Prymnesium_polylepis.1
MLEKVAWNAKREASLKNGTEFDYVATSLKSYNPELPVNEVSLRLRETTHGLDECARPLANNGCTVLFGKSTITRSEFSAFKHAIVHAKAMVQSKGPKGPTPLKGTPNAPQ